MMDPFERRHLIQGLVSTSNAVKQELGRRFAVHLGLQPGPGGPDDGIDGWKEHAGRRIHFQCKLRGGPLGVDDARCLAADIDYHRAQVSVMLAGIGYKDTFEPRLRNQPCVTEKQVVVHLLALDDLFGETARWASAVADLPELRDLASVPRGWEPSDPLL